MPVRISQPLPPSGTPARYEIYRDGTPSSTMPLIDTVPFTSANTDAPNNLFFYVDASGDSSLFYRVIAYDLSNVILADSGPFAFSVATAALIPTRVRVDHNYGTTDAYRYVATSGAGIPGATIRVYQEPDWMAGRTDLAVAVTTTDDDGRWLAPVFLPSGISYRLIFSKEGSYGPDVSPSVVV